MKEYPREITSKLFFVYIYGRPYPPLRIHLIHREGVALLTLN